MYIFKKSFRVFFIHYVSLGFGFVGFFSFRFLTAKSKKSWHMQGTKSNHQTSTAREAAPRNHLFCREVHRILSAVQFGIGGSPSNKLWLPLVWEGHRSWSMKFHFQSSQIWEHYSSIFIKISIKDKDLSTLVFLRNTVLWPCSKSTPFLTA